MYADVLYKSIRRVRPRTSPKEISFEKEEAAARALSRSKGYVRSPRQPVAHVRLPCRTINDV